MNRTMTPTFSQAALTGMLLLVFFTSSAQIPNEEVLNEFFSSSAFSGAQGTETSSINAVHALEKSQELADQLYQDKDYPRAFRMYEALAEHGDKFSQYRLAYMYEHGYSVAKDMRLAFAWSYLAAENGDPGIVKYHRYIRTKFDDTALRQVKPLAAQYLQKYGTYAQASKAKSLISREMRACSGSRTGSSCNKIRASGWKCGIVSGDNVPASDCMMLGMVGLPGFAGLQPADMRKAQQNLNRLQDMYHPGKVELGELRVIKDQLD